MRRRVSVAVVMMVLAAGVAAPAWADDVYSPETLAIARQLQCPVCAGQSVADSNAELARQMRAIIEQKVQAGESEAQIKNYFVDRYGPSILADPPKSGFSLTLWWVPVVAVIGGAGIVWLFLRERTRRGSVQVMPGGPDDSELDEIAREALGPDPHAGAMSP